MAKTIRAFGAEQGSSTFLKMLGHYWVAPVAAVMALFSQHDHNKEKKRIAQEFGNEIGAQVGKTPDKVTVKDMEKVAKKTPAIHEALRRSTARRNLSVGVTIFGAVAGIGLASVVATALFPVAVGASLFSLSTLVHASVAFVSFMGIERVATKIGEKTLKIDEPELQDVVRKPERQAELSVSSQITYLAHLQSQGQRIGQSQVMTVVISANPQLEAQIKSRYGVEFAGLPDNTKLSIMQELGKQMDIAQLTDAINSGGVRVQEMAFASQGQMSGAQRLGPPAEQADAPLMQQAQGNDTQWRDYIRQREAAARARPAELGA